MTPPMMARPIGAWISPPSFSASASGSMPKTIAAVVNPYRANFHPELNDPRFAAEALAALSPPTVPTLYLHGAADGAIGAELLTDVETYLPAPGSAYRLVEGAGHFLHLEQPALVTELIRDWLG